ncbi:hypothetical protein D3C81_1816130 [compost metagenome]
MTSSAVPGADQAVTTGTLSHQLSRMPDSAAPTEMAQTQEVIIAVETSALCAAWKKMINGPE